MYFQLNIITLGVPGSSVVKNPPANAGDTNIPDPGRSYYATEQQNPVHQLLKPALYSLEATTTEAHRCSYENWCPGAQAPKQEELSH